MMKWSEHIARMEGGRSIFKIIKGKITRERPLARCRQRWEDNIRISPKDVCVNTRHWFDSA